MRPRQKSVGPGGDGGAAGADATSLGELLAQPYFINEYLPDHLYAPDRDQLNRLLQRLDEATESSKEHGDALEDFTRAFLGGCKLFEVLGVNRVAVGQIDAACHVKVIPGLVTQDWTPHMIAECKNQKDKVGFPELAKVGAKMDSAKCNTALVVATEGITGDRESFTDAAGYVREQFLAGKRIICFVRDDLERLIRGDNLLKLLQDKINSLHFPPHRRR